VPGEESERFHQAQPEASSDRQTPRSVEQELLEAISGPFQLSDQILEDAAEGKAELTSPVTETFKIPPVTRD